MRTRRFPRLVGLDAATDNPTLAGLVAEAGGKSAQLEAWITKRIGADLAHGVLTTVETELKYEGDLAQQTRQIQQLAQSEGRRSQRAFLTSEFLDYPTKCAKN